jgi:rsbT co-antagonist protein RsbR
MQQQDPWRAGEPRLDTDIDEEELLRRKDFLEFDDNDVEILRSINALAQRYPGSVIDDFYSHLLSFEETSAYFRDPEILKRVD